MVLTWCEHCFFRRRQRAEESKNSRRRACSAQERSASSELRNTLHQLVGRWRDDTGAIYEVVVETDLCCVVHALCSYPLSCTSLSLYVCLCLCPVQTIHYLDLAGAAHILIPVWTHLIELCVSRSVSLSVSVFLSFSALLVPCRPPCPLSVFCLTRYA